MKKFVLVPLIYILLIAVLTIWPDQFSYAFTSIFFSLLRRSLVFLAHLRKVTFDIPEA